MKHIEHIGDDSDDGKVMKYEVAGTRISTVDGRFYDKYVCCNMMNNSYCCLIFRDIDQ